MQSPVCLPAKPGPSFLRAALASLTALALALPLALPLQATPAQALPSGLPTHFAFGLEANPGDTWMPQSGIHWDYRYQYLSGGVNTGAGWETWNSSGTFASGYAAESAQHGFIPMFPYYELLQSSGSCNTCNENQRNLTNLNTTALMNAYYQNFALLMKRLGPGTYDGLTGFGKTALVNVEPDFAGGYAVQAVNNTSGVCFGFCTGQGNDPSLLKAAVGSSGYADVAAYPNTYAGFTQAIAHLRDLYAPNVLLGYDVSPWATGNDIGADTNPGTNAAGLGQQVGIFLSKVGAHELLFNDPLDRDAGQYKAQFGQNRWWDRNNVTFPNFTRWEQYLHGAIAADANRSMLLWQVPVGNQYFDTENNTNGHFQDNRAEYIFGHIQELIGVGIVGAMFGAGNAGNTTYNDGTGDGTTNPTAVCTTDGTSSGQICNSHTSTVADDDGGYLRMQGQAYFTNPVPLSGGAPPTSTPTAAPTVGGTATPTGVATATPPAQSGFSSRAIAAPNAPARGTTASIAATVANPPASPALIDVEVYDPAFTRVAQQVWDNQAFTAGQPTTFTLTWPVPTSAATGAYTVMIGVFSPGWGSVENWNSSAGTFSVVVAGGPTPTSTPTVVATSTPRPTLTPTAKPTNTPTAKPTTTPTPKPTSTAVRTSTPTPGAIQRGFTSSVSAAPAAALRGTSVALTAAVKSNTAISGLVDVEVYDASGVQVFQQVWDNQAFGAGQTLPFSATWPVSATAKIGTYTVMIGVFSPGWGTLYNWNGSAATVTVS